MKTSTSNNEYGTYFTQKEFDSALEYAREQGYAKALADKGLVKLADVEKIIDETNVGYDIIEKDKLRDKIAKLKEKK